jgi:hypothetical protein
MEASAKKVRRAAAQSLASVMLAITADVTQNDVVSNNDGRESKKKKLNSTVKVEDDQADGRSSSASGKAVPSAPFRIEFSELLRQLSSLYARSYSRHVRSGLILSYAIVFKSLGPKFVRSHYAIILEHLLNDIATHPLLGNDRYRSLESRRHINYLLGHVLRRQLLDEPAKTMAVRTIINTLEKKHRMKGNELDVWPVEATVTSMTELCGLLQDLGSAISLEQV